MKEGYCLFYIVRHGQTQWNLDKLLQGHGDSPLTKLGIEQAKRLSKELKDINFDMCFSSDLMRAKKTAEIITLEKKLAIQTTKLLRERSYGDFEGGGFKAYDAFMETVEKLTEEEKKSYQEGRGVEPYEATVARMLTFLKEVAVENPGKTALVVTHGGIMVRLLLHLDFWGGKPRPKGAISNGAIIKLTSDGIDFFIEETRDIKR